MTAQGLAIQDPALVEKDYWLMHVLWGLQQQKLSFHLKGGTSLSKGHGCIHFFILRHSFVANEDPEKVTKSKNGATEFIHCR